MMGMRFSSVAKMQSDWVSDPSFFFQQQEPFYYAALEEIGERLKYVNVIAHAQGYVFKIKARLEETEASQKHFLKLALHKFEEALQYNPNNKVTLRNCAGVLANLSELEIDPKQTREYLKAAEEYYHRSVTTDSCDTHSTFQYASFLQACGKFAKSQEYYILSLEADPYHWDCLFSYANLLHQTGHIELSKQLYARASQMNTFQNSLVCEQCGKTGHTKKYCDRSFNKNFS